MLDFPRPPAGIRIVALKRMASPGRWRTEAMRSYTQPVLYWITHGQGRFTIQGISRGYGAHNAILVPAGVMHGFDTAGPIGGTLLFLPNDGDMNLPDDPLHMRIREVRDQAALNIQIETIRLEIERDAVGMDRALSHHVGLLSIWLERQAGDAWNAETTAPSRACESLASAYASLLERHFHEGHGVADYARALGVTPSHLSRACRESSGRPASALLQDRIHFEARRLLRDSRRPVREIASDLGFRSAAYFTRAFSALAGMTPSAYRRSGGDAH